MTRHPVPNPYCRPAADNDLLRARARFLDGIRDFFRRRDFLEVETPILIPCADPSPHLCSFRTSFQPMSGPPRPMFLQTSPEFAMKRLLAGGYPRIFQLCKFFRDGEETPHHNPEFTGLEWYQVGGDYHTLMDMTEEMLRELWPQQTLTYQGICVDLAAPWERLSVDQAMQRHVGCSLTSMLEVDALIELCRARGVSVTPDEPWDDLFFKLFLTFVEPHLGMQRPTFLYDYPIQLAALARPGAEDPSIAERVELYIAGLELANGYSELTDPKIQRQRWEDEIAIRQQHGEEKMIADPGLLEALEWGMPDCAGIAVGIDRLLMLQRDAAAIEEVLPFAASKFDWGRTFKDGDEDEEA